MIMIDAELMEWAGKGGIKPYVYSNLNPASIDLMLGNRFRDMDNLGQLRTIGKSGITLYPRSFKTELYNWLVTHLPLRRPRRCIAILATTVETIQLSNSLAGEVKLKTTPCRAGLGYPIADWVDPGFEGQITLVLSAVKPIILTPGMRICQLVLYQLPRRVVRGYQERSGHYMHQQGPTPAWWYKEKP